MNPITTQITGVIGNAVFDKINSLNLGISSDALRAIVARVAEEAAALTVSSVNLTSNKQLSDIPKNLIGIINPVNLVTGNLGSTGVSSNLSNILDVQITGAVTNSLVVALTRELKAILPAGSNLINFSDLADKLVEFLAPTISQSVGTSLKAFTDSIFNKKIEPQSLIPSIDSIFQRNLADPGKALEQVNEVFVGQTANKYLEKATQFDINSNENKEKLEVLKKGFNDPSANFPTKEYKGRPDTNKLATGDVSDTIIQKKESQRMSGAKLPGGESWDEPRSSYKAEYPYNKVTQTESGHIIEIDDTPGSERLHIYHRSGTYVEIDPNGSVIKRTKGSSYEIIDRNGKIAIAGKADISISGACNIYVGNDANIEVDGDTNITCHNDVTVQAGGTLNVSAVEEINMTSSNVRIEAYNEMHLKSNKILNISVENKLNMSSADQMFVESDSFYHTTSNAYNESENTYNKASGSIFNQTGSDFHVKAGGNFNADTGGEAHLNSGNAQDSQSSQPSTPAQISNIGILSGRKDIVYFDMFDPVPLTLADTVTLDMEEGKQSLKEQKAHRDKLLTSGLASAGHLDSRPVEQDKVDVQSSQTIVVPGAEELLKATLLPGNYKLSPNFTLEMLSSKAAITKDEIYSTELSYGQIVYNLQLVALNILEPVYNIYPNAFVTSGFRLRSKSSGTSQHPLGHAVDIQFKNASKSDYFEIAKQLAKVLRYDQLLLEFCAYTNNPWIHISYTGKTERSQVMTFWNHQKYNDGLTQLA